MNNLNKTFVSPKMTQNTTTIVKCINSWHNSHNLHTPRVAGVIKMSLFSTHLGAWLIQCQYIISIVPTALKSSIFITAPLVVSLLRWRQETWSAVWKWCSIILEVWKNNLSQKGAAKGALEQGNESQAAQGTELHDSHDITLTSLHKNECMSIGAVCACVCISGLYV